MTTITTDDPAPALRASPWSRLSDRLNPILVREVQQAIKGRVFPLTVFATLVVCVSIALFAASRHSEGADGRGAFYAGLATLVPLVIFIVPMHAYQSMRTELKGGIVEQLLLSRLTPGAVLFGKLQTAMVQFVLYVSVLAPLLATTYLLRGVDLPTILLSLGFAMVLCLAATAFAVSSAAQAIVPALQGVASLGIALGLGIATFGLIGFVLSGTYAMAIGALLRSGHLWPAVSALVLLAAYVTVLSWLAARSFLVHAFENKSTGFRVFLFVAPVFAYAWMLLAIELRYWSEVFAGMTFGMTLIGVCFGAFMVTEQRGLSPRVRAHAPAAPALALPATVLLPGRDRGLLCYTVYAVALLLVGMLGWPAWGSSTEAKLLGRSGLMVLVYGLVYLSIGRWLRGRLADNLQGNHIARVMLPLLLFLCIVLPVVFDLLVSDRVRGWHLGHVMNPFWTIDQFVGDRWPRAVPVLIAVAVLMFVLQLPIAGRALREVTAAIAARRARAAGGATAAAAARAEE
ncbi:MAG: hypothetical protein H6835_02070 [Planctomycetes bacterium]|nr:hypothetical protein [Planctomycetota bacterium]